MAITSATRADALAAALDAAGRGWPVFPLAGKVPFAGSHGHLDATADPAAIRDAMNARRAISYGVRTGAPSGLIILDFDDADARAALEAQLGGLPAGPVLITASGREHCYFRHPGGHVPSPVGALAPRVDVRADGSYGAGDGSTLPDGRRYRWEASSHPDDVPLPPLPPAWLAAIRGTAAPRPAAITDGAAPIAEGSRNHGLAQVAGHLRRVGLSESAMRAALAEVNAERCRPPLPDADVARIAASVARYPAGQLPPLPAPPPPAATTDPCEDTRDALAAARAELAAAAAENDRLRAERDASRQRADVAERRAAAAESYARSRQQLDAAGTLRNAEAPVAEAAARTLVAAMGHGGAKAGGWYEATAVEIGAKAGIHAKTAGGTLANISSGGVIEYRVLTINDPASGEVRKVGHLRPGPRFPVDVAPGLAGVAGVLDAIAAHPIERTRRGAPVGDHGGVRVKSDRPVCPHCQGTEVACVTCGALLDAAELAPMLADAAPPTPPVPTGQLVPSENAAGGMALRTLMGQVVPSVAAPRSGPAPPMLADLRPEPTAQVVRSAPPPFGGMGPAPPDRFTDAAAGARP